MMRLADLIAQFEPELLARYGPRLPALPTP